MWDFILNKFGLNVSKERVSFNVVNITYLTQCSFWLLANVRLPKKQFSGDGGQNTYFVNSLYNKVQRSQKLFSTTRDRFCFLDGPCNELEEVWTVWKKYCQSNAVYTKSRDVFIVCYLFKIIFWQCKINWYAFLNSWFLPLRVTLHWITPI